MRLMKKLMAAASDAFQIVHIVREGSATNREVQCEGDRDETETGREVHGEVWSLGPAGLKHRAAPKTAGVAKEKGLILRLGNLSILLGAHLSDGEPTGLDEGETAIYSAGGAQVRCTSTVVEIGTTSGGLLIRKDDLVTWWNATPRANHMLHKHQGMPGPGATGVPDTDLGAVGAVESHEGHKVD